MTTSEKVHKDKNGDVIWSKDRRDLTRMVDLKDIDGEDSEINEKENVDIRKFTIRENSTFITFKIETRENIGTQEQFFYVIAGYSSDDHRSTDPYDFRLIFNQNNVTYLVLEEGEFVEGHPVSAYGVEKEILTIEVNKGNFNLQDGTIPSSFAVFAYLDVKVEQFDGHHIDFLITDDDDDKDDPLLDENSIVLIQFLILGLAFAVVLIVWNIYNKRKEEEDQGGICPRCEARLDVSLDFCPSCGTFIRGPKARSKKVKPELAPLPDMEE
jgi:hypothetical protein